MKNPISEGKKSEGLVLMCLLQHYTVAGLEGQAKHASIRASVCVDSNEELN